MLSASALGAVFLAAVRQEPKATRCLDAIRTTLGTGADAFRPFATPFSEFKDARPGDLKDAIYAAGSLQAALACQRLGRAEEGARIAAEVAKLQSRGGGIRTLARALPGVEDYLDVPCAEDTAWWIIASSPTEAAKLFDRSTDQELSLPPPPGPSDPVPPGMADPLEASLARALHWIEKHLVRTRDVPEWPRMLKQTYDDRGQVTTRAARPPADCAAIWSLDLSPDHRDYRFVGRHGRSSVYDNALAVIVLVMAGKPDLARGILNTLGYLQQDDGGLPFSFNTGGDTYCSAYVKTGATCWAGYAATYYQLRTADKRFQLLAERIGGWVLQQQVTKENDPRCGLVTGGFGRFQKHAFIGERAPWAAMEHQVDAFFFLRGLARATGRKEYADGAAAIKEAVLKRLWCGDEGRFFAGVSLEEGIDQARALDCVSWGAVFAWAVGDPEKAKRCLGFAEQEFATLSKDDRVRGYRPYAGAIGDYARQIPNWSDMKTVWSEGSWGVACAALKLGDRAKANAIAAEMLKMQVGSGPLRAPIRGPIGGVYYVTDELPDFLACPSAAGTCWHALVLLLLREKEPLVAFWGKEEQTKHVDE